MSAVVPAAGSGVALFLPPIGEVVLSAIIVAIIAFALIKFALPKYNAIADERARIVAEGIKKTEEAKEAAAHAAATADKTIEEARMEATAIREAAHQDGQNIVAAARAQATEEANRIVEHGKVRVDADVQAARTQLREDVGRLASELADRIVGEHLQDEALSSRVIDRFLDDIEKQSPQATAGEGRS